MKVAVIGAGVCGLTCAHRLTKAGHTCHVYERWPGLGGQAATVDLGDGHLVERYYHHLFPSDRDIVRLYDELSLPDEVEWIPSRMAVYAEGGIHPFTTPLDLLRFRPLSLWARLRMAAAILALQRRHREVAPFEDVTAVAWIERTMGEEVLRKLWGPLLHAKFGGRAEELSMAWLWSKLTLRRKIRVKEARREVLGYPRRTFEPLFAALRDSVEAGGGRVLIDRPAARLARDGGSYLVTPGRPGSFRRGHDPRGFEPTEDAERYDAVVATVPSDVFEQLLDPELARRLDQRYLERVRSTEYQAALCLLLELDRPLSGFYWTSVADPALPFLGIIEQTNLVSPDRYGGRRLVYVANYRAHGDPLLDLEPDDLLALYEPGLRMLNPAFSRTWVRARWLFREPAAQPIVTAGYQRRMPPLETGLPGLVLANTSQVYPEDRGTNYAVRLGSRAAEAVATSVDRRAVRETGGRPPPSGRGSRA